MLIASLQGNFSSGVFTHFKRIANYGQRDKESLRQEVLNFFKSTGLSKDNVVLGIPRKDIVLRYLDLPSEVADNLKQVIQYQVQSFEPTEEDKYYYDYSRLNGAGTSKRLSILLAMVKKSTLDDYLRLLRGFGIRPVAVAGSSMGLANIFLQNRKDLQDNTCILADLKSSSIEILALNRGAFAYSREVPREGDQSWKDLLLREVDEAISKIRLAPESSLEQIVLAGESSESAYAEIKAAIPDCKLMKSFYPRGSARRKQSVYSGSGFHAWPGLFGHGAESFRYSEPSAGRLSESARLAGHMCPPPFWAWPSWHCWSRSVFIG